MLRPILMFGTAVLVGAGAIIAVPGASAASGISAPQQFAAVRRPAPPPTTPPRTNPPPPVSLC